MKKTENLKSVILLLIATGIAIGLLSSTAVKLASATTLLKQTNSLSSVKLADEEETSEETTEETTEEATEEAVEDIEEFDFDKYTGAMQKYIANEYEDELKQFGGEKGAYMRELYADYIESYSESFDISYTILNRDSWVKEDLDYMEEYFSEYHKVNADVTQALSLTLDITIKKSLEFSYFTTAQNKNYAKIIHLDLQG